MEIMKLFEDAPPVHYDPAVIRDNPVIIYGAGYCGIHFCELMQNAGLLPVCFFDSNKLKSGKVIMNAPVYLPKVFDNGEKYLVVVCIFQKGKLYEQIHDMLIRLGYKNIVHIYELRADRQLFAHQNLIISPDIALLKNNLENIKKVGNILSDDLSRTTYLKIMQFLIDSFDTVIPSLPIREQYFDYDIFNKNQEEVFVDCGAFQGDVMDIFLSSNKFKEYHAIEPDPYYVSILNQKKIRYHEERIVIYPVAASDESGTVNIRNYGNENSVIVADGEQRVSCLPLDDLLRNVYPTFIKIDAEGYEKCILKGANNIIRSLKPILAIAIYHHEADLWELPLFLAENYSFYSFYIRSYMNVQETVLYAVPQNRSINNNEIH